LDWAMGKSQNCDREIDRRLKREGRTSIIQLISPKQGLAAVKDLYCGSPSHDNGVLLMSASIPNLSFCADRYFRVIVKIVETS
jgi:hypothetical protein